MNAAEYNITLNSERGIVEVVIRGEIPIVLGDEVITKALQTAADHGYHIVCDVRESSTKASLADWFFLPRRLAAYLNTRTRGIRTALVVAKGDQEDTYRFFETVTRNLGMNIQVFLDEKEAWDWLTNLGRDGSG